MSASAPLERTTSVADHPKRLIELSISERTVRRLYLVIFAMNALVILVTALSDLKAGIARLGVVLWFDLKLEGNIAVWYSSALLLITAFAALAVAANPPPLLHPYRHRVVWCLAAAFFAGLSVDETAQLHETVGRIFAKRIGHIEWLTGGDKPTFMWVIVFLPAIVLFVFVLRIAAQSLRAYRRSRNLTLVAAGCWLGVIAAEVVQSQLVRFSRDRSIQGVLEEGLEILGAAFFFVAFVEYLLSMQLRRPEHGVNN
ncbi:MAG: hypothetical protein HUU41_08520 [Bryobacteraceae bacterium]|nr:hypothetical protein [Bryobacterales bacterium]MEB2360999.1 hypothetical protein [Bryobacterales bacterium]NUN01144.1 hypothetical protein [Bryobacteraceae bacterium]